ncbi:hypothetical protein R1flu_014764 [Riccia fluitans]|uniref:Uncharacterized protein n=1 Tax=Riccia fluitans TaxID=41844 RepID=A0ABD1YH11_9MARC
MEETPETVLIAVDTNFDTNLVVIPPRSATIADVREKIKQGHTSLYPSYGSINILAVKVELFDRHYLLEETQIVGQIFRGWQGCLHVELAGYPPSSPTASRLRLPLISTGDKVEVLSPSKSRMYPLPRAENLGDRPRSTIEKAQRPASAPQESSLPLRHISQFSPNRTVASQALEVVGSQKSSDGRNSSERFFRSQDVIQHRPSGPEGQGIETVEAGLDIALDALLDVGPERHVNVEGSTDGAAGNNGRAVATKDTVVGTQASIHTTPRKVAGSKSSKTQFSGDSKLSGDRKRRAGDPANLDLQKQGGGSASKKNRVKSSVKIDGSSLAATPMWAEKPVDDKNTDDEPSSNESGPEKVDGSSGQAVRANLLCNAESMKDQNAVSTTSKPSEKAVCEGRQIGAREPTRAAKADSSGSSSSESSEKRPAKQPMKRKILGSHPPRKPAKVQDESSDESSSLGASSESYRPDASAGTRGVDEVVDKLVSMYSPIISEGERGEQSSDASEERQPKGVRNRRDSGAADEADNATDSKSRRGSRQTAGLNKFQHFIDSQDGLDQLLGLTLSARKSKLLFESEPEPQVPAAQTGKSALDSLTIEVVPDTQVGTFDVNDQKEVEEIMQAEKNAGNGSKEAALEPAGGPAAVSPTGRGEKNKSPMSKSKGSNTLSGDTNDDPSDPLKNFAKIASESARKLGSNEDPLQPKSDDSQQFLSAVQLTRLAMADDDDDAQSDPMRSPKEGSKEEEKRSVATPNRSVEMSRENGLPEVADKTGGTDSGTSALAGVSAILHEDIPEHSSKEDGDGKSRVDAGSPPSVRTDAEKSLDASADGIEVQLRAGTEAVARDSGSQQQEPLEQQMEKEKPSEAITLAENLTSVLDHIRSEHVTPGTTEKKKLSARKPREGKIARGKGHKLNISENGEDGERPLAENGTEDVPHVSDSPVQEDRTGGIAEDEPFLIREERPAEKSVRNKKIKKSIRAAESPEREERLGRSVIEIEESSDKGFYKMDAVRGRQGLEQVKVEDEKYDMGAAVTTKRRKKKLRSDGENVDEAFERVKLKRCSLNSGSYPSNADDDVTNENLTSVPDGESLAFRKGGLVEDQTATERPVSKKKKKPRRAASVEHAPGWTDAETTGGRKESNQISSGVEVVVPVPETAHLKPPKPRRKKGSKLLEQQSAGDTAGLERKLVKDVEFVDFDSKDDILGPKPGLFVSVTSADGGVPTESVKRRKKKRAYGGIESDLPSGIQRLSSSPTRENELEANEEKIIVGAPVEDHGGVKIETPKRKKKKRSSVMEEENYDALEPSCNQLGYRRSDVSEVDRDVSRKFEPVDDVFRDEQPKTKKKRAKSSFSKVEKAVTVSSSSLEISGSLRPKSKKKKQLPDQELNVDAGATFKRLLRGEVLSSENARLEEAACSHPGCSRVFLKKSSAWFRHVKHCELKTEGLHTPEPNQPSRKNRSQAL